jgi:Trk-type K+ transport system membrane component
MTDDDGRGSRRPAGRPTGPGRGPLQAAPLRGDGSSLDDIPASGRTGARRSWLRDVVDEAARRSPARLALTVFAAVIAVFVALLCLPFATATGDRAPFVDALFTGVSAVCVTGLTTVDTATYWSGFGQAVILAGIKVGGLGILTLASLLGLAVSRRLGLAQRLVAQSEVRASRLSEVGALLRVVVVTSTAIEVVVAAVLFPRFLLEREGVGKALWHAVFYAVSAFNNAGFAVHEGGLTRWAGDAWILLPIAVAVFAGSLGFPVVLVLVRGWRRPAAWPVHTKLTLATTSLLLVVSVVAIGAFEWANPATLGALDPGARVLSAVFEGTMPRSGGFSTVDVGQMNETTWLFQDVLMFIGGGSASTAGGIKVGTLAVLVLAAVAEARGDKDIEAYGRRIPATSVRLAVTVLLAGLGIVLIATLGLLAITGDRLDRVLFEVISAFATCGLSTGLTGDLQRDGGKYLLAALMYVGRTGTVTLAAALALRERSRAFRLPEERPIVG